jgi:hypothetical protein
MRRALLAAATSVSLAAGVWLGCSGDDNTAPTTTSRRDAAIVPDTFAPPPPPPADSGLPPPPVDSGPGPDTAVPPSVACATYCDDITQRCLDAPGGSPDAASDAGWGGTQYTTKTKCLAECAFFDAGTSGETTVNSLACRQFHVDRAAEYAPPHCPAAGPYGAGVCGARCDSFCALALAQCNGEAGVRPFATLADCMLACGGFAFDASAGESPTGPASGNTLNCREYHLQNAFDDPATHCAHIGVADGSAALPCR